MPKLTEFGAAVLVISLAIVLLFGLIFAFRDTVRGIVEFFDLRAIRRFFRRPWRAAAVIGGLVLFFVSLWFLLSKPGGSLFYFLGVAPLVLVPSLALLWLIVSDIYQGVRKRRRQRRDNHRSE